MTTFADGVYQWGGVPVGTNFLHVGRPIFVRPSTGTDGADGLTPSTAVQTLVTALSLATANHGDCVYLIAESNTAASTTDYQSTALNWNKDGVHLVGISDRVVYGSRARIAQLSTVKTIETLLTVSANNCFISGIEIFQGVTSSTATSPVALSVTGQRNHFVDCQISGNGDTAQSMDTAGARSLLVAGGAENLFDSCVIGLDTCSRATAAAEIEFTSSAKRNVFRNCIVPTMSGAAGYLFVKADAASSSCDRSNTFIKCIFDNAVDSTATTMTAAVAAHASLGGHLVLFDCMVIGATDITAADSSKVRILGASGSTAASDVQKEMLLARTVDVA